VPRPGCFRRHNLTGSPTFAIGDAECGLVLQPPEPMAQPTCARLAGPAPCHYHPSVAHNQILNGASVISSPFIGVELTSWKDGHSPK
jgi:hypothetical protein